MSTYRIKPRITEKSYRTAGEGSIRTYTFVVPKELDKETIKKIVEKTHKVNVTDVHTITLPGKVRRFKGVAGRTSSVKKALVRLKAGETIAAFDQPSAATGEKE